jgi:hypothetical protein
MNSQSTLASGNQQPVVPVSVTAQAHIVHVPVDARGVALGILATVALVFALDWMQKLLVPLLLGE